MKTKLNSAIAALLLTAAAAFLTSCASTGSTVSTSTSSGGGTAASNPAPTGGTKPYPLKTCIITDNDLGSMGDEQRIVYQGQEIKFCCKPCEAKFLKNPAKYLAKLN
jgi:hypothetical protein